MRIPTCFDLIPRQEAFHRQGPVSFRGLRSIAFWTDRKIEKISSIVRFPRIRDGNEQVPHPHGNSLLPKSQEKRIKNVSRFKVTFPVIKLPSSFSLKVGKTMERAVDDESPRSYDSSILFEVERKPFPPFPGDLPHTFNFFNLPSSAVIFLP
jgi:hypothetical protein